MSGKLRKRIGLIVGGIFLVLILIFSFRPTPVLVEAHRVGRGLLQVTVEEEGETRVEDRYVISAPVTAYTRRIDLNVGDSVSRGQALLQLEPPRSPILDPRTERESNARVRAAESSVRQAEQTIGVQEATARRAQEELTRVQNLFSAGSATQQTLDQVRTESDQANASLQAAQAAAETARHELEAARAGVQNMDVARRSTGSATALYAPTGGRILSIPSRSERMVSAGETLMEIGDTRDLEVRVNVLSQDAVRIRPGTRVLIEQWGGDSTLDGRVKRIEPTGIKTVSSLGVEEQRVSVVAGITSPLSRWSQLGDGYRVIARFIVFEANQVVQVPSSALFRQGNNWSVFVVEENRAKLKPVRIGYQTGLSAEIRGGLIEGEQVITNPSNDLKDGMRVKVQDLSTR